jgi:hypothetical protein
MGKLSRLVLSCTVSLLLFTVGPTGMKLAPPRGDSGGCELATAGDDATALARGKETINIKFEKIVFNALRRDFLPEGAVEDADEPIGSRVDLCIRTMR